jgi:calcineurin-like phosphoesterase family protein
MNKIYFSSDHHFSHSNVIKYCNRPYTSVQEMNEDLIQRWNNQVKPEDTVYYLGDFSLGKNAVREITNFKIKNL